MNLKQRIREIATTLYDQACPVDFATEATLKAVREWHISLKDCEGLYQCELCTAINMILQSNDLGESV